METSTQTTNTFRLSEMIKVLFRKILWLLLTAVVGAAIGAGIGFLKTRNSDSYGTTVQFYINPKTEDQSIHQIYGAYSITPMTDMLNLLESDFFSEYLLLDDNGLPFKDNPEASNKAEINAKIDVANAKLATLEAAKKAVEDAETAIDNTETEVEDAKMEVANAKKVVDEAGDAATQEQKNALAKAQNALTEAQNALVEARDTLTVKQEAVKEAKTAANNAIEAAVEEWRKDSSYKNWVARVSSCITFTQKNASSSATIANSFISVEISVPNDKDFADLLLTKIKTKVPSYVEANMYLPTDTLKTFDVIGGEVVEIYKPLYIGTSCQRMSRIDDITLLNDGAAEKTIIKYAVVLGFLGGIAACAVVLFLHYRKTFFPVQAQVEQPNPQEAESQEKTE